MQVSYLAKTISILSILLKQNFVSLYEFYLIRFNWECLAFLSPIWLIWHSCCFVWGIVQCCAAGGICNNLFDFLDCFKNHQHFASTKWYWCTDTLDLYPTVTSSTFRASSLFAGVLCCSFNCQSSTPCRGQVFCYNLFKGFWITREYLRNCITWAFLCFYFFCMRCGYSITAMIFFFIL